MDAAEISFSFYGLHLPRIFTDTRWRLTAPLWPTGLTIPSRRIIPSFRNVYFAFRQGQAVCGSP
jgi:hypothetical protein